MIDPTTSLLVTLVLLAAFSLFAYWRRALDQKGVIAACIFGLLTWWLGEQTIGGIWAFSVILVFFVLGELFTRLGRKRQGSRHELRGISNIFGNIGAGTIYLALLSPPAFFGAIATALGDTMSSEIGMLSKRKPRLITTMARVQKGTDGGITRLGLLMSLFGAAIIGVLAWWMLGSARIGLFVTAAGFAGGLVDSLLGAVLERRGTLDNTWVNFFACMAGGALSWAATLFLL